MVLLMDAVINLPDCAVAMGSITWNGTNYVAPHDVFFHLPHQTSVQSRFLNEPIGITILTNILGLHPAITPDPVAAFEDFGYVDGISMFGATYDYRFSPDGLQDYYAFLRKLVEDVSNRTQQKVTLYAIGNGAMVTVAFFDYIRDNVGADWAKKYLCHFYSESGLYSGAVESIFDVTNAMGIWLPTDENQLVLRNATSTWPVFYWNFPRLGPGPNTYNDSSKWMIKDPVRNYTAPQMGEFLNQVFGTPEPNNTWARVRNITSQPFNPPLVNTTAIQASGEGTPVGTKK